MLEAIATRLQAIAVRINSYLVSCSCLIPSPKKPPKMRVKLRLSRAAGQAMAQQRSAELVVVGGWEWGNPGEQCIA